MVREHFAAANIHGDGSGAVISIFNSTGATFPNPFTLSGYTLELDQPMTETGNWTIAPSGNLSHSYNAFTQANSLSLTLNGNLTVATGGSINVDGKGYSNSNSNERGPGGQDNLGGGCHGGRGGLPALVSACNTYDSITAPTQLGSASTGAYGGGAARLIVSGTMSIYGTVSANGGTSNSNGGGAGGSVYLTTGTLAGSGIIQANGGIARGGVGGGGRVAVIVTSGSGFDHVATHAFGGQSPFGEPANLASAAGTVYLERTAIDGTGKGHLIIDNNNVATSTALGITTPISSLSMSHGSGGSVGTVTIRNSGFFALSTGVTLNVAGNWSDSVGTSLGSGTVVLDGTNQTLSGSTTFWNLTDIPASGAATLHFNHLTPITISGALILNGATGSTLSLRSTATGSVVPFTLDPVTGTQNLVRLDVEDMYASNGQTLSCLSGCVNSGNNVNWNFGSLTISTTTLTSSLNPSTSGATVTLKATVSPSLATGTLTFKDNGTTIATAIVGHGSGSYTISNLTIGSHPLTAVYGGDSTYAASTSNTVTQVVNNVIYVNAGTGLTVAQGAHAVLSGSIQGTDPPFSNYLWNFGDGGTGNTLRALHDYSNPGRYTAVLTVTDAQSHTESGSETVTVTNVPPVAANIGPYVGTAGQAVPFIDGYASESGTLQTESSFTYHWDFGDSSGSDVQLPTHVYAAPGTYTVTLTATDASGAESTPQTGTATILAAPTVPAGGEDLSPEFDGPFASWWNVKNFGAVGDGVHDDTAAIQSALNLLRTHSTGSVLYFPAGTYRVTSTLTTTNVDPNHDYFGVSLIGENPLTTTILYDGPAGGSLLFLHFYYGKISRLTLDGNGKANVLLWKGPYGFSTYGEISDMIFKDAADGILLGNSSTGDAENAMLRDQFIRLSNDAVASADYNSMDEWAWDSRFEDNRVSLMNYTGDVHAFADLFLRSTVDDVLNDTAGRESFLNNTSIGSYNFLNGLGVIGSLADNRILDPVGTTVWPILYNGSALIMDNIFKARDGDTRPQLFVSTGATIILGNTFSVANPVVNGRGNIEQENTTVDPSTIDTTPPLLPPIPPNRNRQIFDLSPGATTDQIQSAINSAAALTGERPVVHLPPGNYSITKQLVVPANTDLQIIGDGAESTFLNASGATGSVILLEGPSHATVSDLSIIAGAVTGILVQNADQDHGKIFVDQVAAAGNTDTELLTNGFLINGVEKSDIFLRDPGTGESTDEVHVIGGPLRNSGQTASGQVTIVGGAGGSGDHYYNVEKGGRLVVRDVYHEGAGSFPQPISLSGSGILSIEGSILHFAASKTIPSFLLNNFSGLFAMFGGNFSANNDNLMSWFQLQGDGAALKALVAVTDWTEDAGQPLGTVWKDLTSPTATSGFLENWSASGAYVNTGSTDPAFLDTMVQPARETRMWLPGIADSGVTALDLHRITVTTTSNNVGNGIEFDAAAEASTTTLSSSLNPSNNGSGVTLTATVSPAASATGTLTFKDGATVLGTATLSHGSGSYSTSALTSGGHSLTAVYSGNDYYLPSTSSPLTQTVTGSTPTTTTLTSSLNPATFGSAITLTAAVSPSTATGTITFKDGGTTLGTATLSNGSGSYSTSALGAGSHSVTAVYSGNIIYGGSTSVALTQQVDGAASSTVLTSSLNPSTFGSSITFTAVVSPSTATGTVTFIADARVVGDTTLSHGSGSYTTSSLSAGNHSLIAVYSGNSDISTSTSSALTQTVNKAATSIVVISNINPSSSGQLVTFLGSVSPLTATGTITFKDGATTLGTATLGHGSGSFATSTLTVGTHGITALYGGNTDYLTSTSTSLSQRIAAVLTPKSTTLTSSLNPSTVGSGITLTATVSPNTATGTLTFKDATTPLATVTVGHGSGSYTTSALVIGSHSLTAIYTGSGTYSGSTSAALTQVVQGLPTVTTLSSSALDVTQGASVMLTATVSPSTATGTVTFKDGSTTLGTATLKNGSGSYSTSSLATGSHSLTAVYGGNQTYAGSTSATVTQLVSAPATGGGGGGGSSGGGGGGDDVSILPLDLSMQGTTSSTPAGATATSSGLSMTVNQTTITFRDVPTTSWFAPYIAELVTKGIVSGYEDKLGHPLGLFGPGNPVTYAEVAKMAILGAGLSPATTVPQNRSARNQWSASYIAEAEMLHLAPYTLSINVNTKMS